MAETHNSIEKTVEAEVAKVLKKAIPYTVNKAVGGALAAACGSLRQRSYDFNPITPEELIVQPERINNPNYPAGRAILLTNRLMYVSGCFLLTVMYGVDGKYKASLTTFVEEALDKIQIVTLPEDMQAELERQIQQLPPMDKNSVVYRAVYVSDNYFDGEDNHTREHSHEHQTKTEQQAAKEPLNESPTAPAIPAPRARLPEPRN